MSLLAAVAVAAAFQFNDAYELPWRTYVDAQLERTDDRVLPPPPDIAVYFGKHAAEIKDLRAHPIVSANSADMILLTRILVAHALSHHDWDDLGAAWEMQRRLWREPAFVSRLTALRGSLMIVAAARKLQPPAPKWFYEVLAVDVPRAIADALVADSEKMRLEMAKEETSDSLGERLIDAMKGPYMAASAGDYADAMRATTASMLGSRRCIVNEKEFSDRLGEAMAFWNPWRRYAPIVGRLWQRTASFALERERTMKTLQLKAGATPSASSQCSDVTWKVEGGALKFSKVP